MYSAWSNKNIVCWKETWWRRGASGASPSFDACTSWIFLGVHGHPQAWAFVCLLISSRKNTGYHATDPKIRTQGAECGRSWITTKHGDGSLESLNTQRTVERDTELYPGSGPSWWGKTPTSCLLVLRRNTSRGVQGLGYRALAGRR
jgi:hypothetical protein